MRNNKKYQDPTPYPEIKVENENIQYAAILQDDYSGIVSEMSALTQYMYHHYSFEETHPEIAELLRGVAINEMRHMEILGEVITMLGGDPRYSGSYSNCFTPWNGTYVKTAISPRKKLLLDIEDEKAAIRQYNAHIEAIDDKYIKAILKRIILDEELHIKLFEEALKTL